MRDVGYFAPTEIGEAVKLLAEHGEKIAVLAGGTDLVPALNYYEIKPSALLYIGGLGLDYIKEENGKLVIGAGTTLAHLLASDVIASKFGILFQAINKHSSVAVRTAATIGGNVGTGSPAGDLIPPLMVMDAEVVLVSTAGERLVPIAEFFTGPQETVRKPNELIVELRVPLAAGNTAYEKVGLRKAQTCATTSVAVRLAMDGHVCKDVRIVMGSMAPTPLRCKQAEALLKGKAVNQAAIEACAAQAITETSPIDDQRATAWYRRKAGKAIVARALAQAAGIQS
jgi:carbon-monoxide dehydrogenase medium subunit